MRKIALFLLSVLLIQSCNLKFVPLKGSYPPTPIIYTSDKSFNEVWDNIIDFFAQKGVPIHLVDRSSGLIISSATNLTWSFEDKNGALTRKSAYIALAKYVDPGTKKAIKPIEIKGKWNIRIKDLGNSKTSVNINLHELAGFGEQFNAATYSKKTREFAVDGKTTGNFEKMIFDQIK